MSHTIMSAVFKMLAIQVSQAGEELLVSCIGDAHDRGRSGLALAAPDAPNYSRSGTGTLKPLRVVDTRL
jgi:hypothetical protein